MSESALARAVRDQIRLNSAYNDRDVDVELDEVVPPVKGELYIIVIPAGIEAGPTHESSGCVIDELFSIDIVVIRRSPRVPSDRERKLFIAITRSFEVDRRNILSAVDFSYSVLTAANAYILAEESSSEGFIEPLKQASVGRFRTATAETFRAAPGETNAGVARTISYRGARRIQTRSG